MNEKAEKAGKKVVKGTENVTVKEEVSSPPISNLTDMVDRTAERISFLKKKQEDLQKEKADLQDLRAQREELDSVKREVLVNLERGIAVLDKEESDLKRKHSLVKFTREEFDKIISEVRGIKEKSWKEENLKAELARALAIVAKAKREYTEAQGKVDALSLRISEDSSEQAVSVPIRSSQLPENLPDRPGELFRRGLFLFLPAALLAILVAIAIHFIALIK